ncbi:hypothetical protein HDU91_003631 [Kappamyces sp. JEL0680]|nr:hypothetical protein HDU91_003631 [Kappamyces sp. JEL0680]
MRSVPSPVVVVTAAHQGICRGMTCSSFTSISLVPPIVSFAIKTPSAMAGLLESLPADKSFAVHLLSDHQISQSTAFSSPKSQDRVQEFPHFNYTLGDASRLPILRNCLAVLVCRPYRSLVVGDHQVWYGLVEEILQDGIGKNADGTYETLRPLLYYQQQYRSIGDEVFIRAFEDTSLAFGEWTHRSHVRMAWIYFSAAARGELSDNPVDRIKQGIQEYNKANADRIKHGYNETITSFFCHLVQLAVEESPEITDFICFLEAYPFLDRFSIVFSYYSKERLYSSEAKKSFLPPDVLPLPASMAEVRSLDR